MLHEGLWFIGAIYICIIGFKFTHQFGIPCNASLATVRSVNSCPLDKASFERAAQRMNCADIKNNCTSFEYHCVLNDYLNETIEVCAPSLGVIGHVCTKFDRYQKSIFRIEDISCKNSTPPCPFSYNSTTLYNYRGCYNLSNIARIIAKFTTLKRTTAFATTTQEILKTTVPDFSTTLVPDKGDDEDETADIIVGVVVGVLIAVAVVIGSLIICLKHKWRIQRRKRNRNLLEMAHVQVNEREGTGGQLLHDAGEDEVEVDGSNECSPLVNENMGTEEETECNNTGDDTDHGIKNEEHLQEGQEGQNENHELIEMTQVNEREGTDGQLVHDTDEDDVEVNGSNERAPLVNENMHTGEETECNDTGDDTDHGIKNEKHLQEGQEGQSENHVDEMDKDAGIHPPTEVKKQAADNQSLTHAKENCQENTQSNEQAKSERIPTQISDKSSLPYQMSPEQQQRKKEKHVIAPESGSRRPVGRNVMPPRGNNADQRHRTKPENTDDVYAVIGQVMQHVNKKFEERDFKQKEFESRQREITDELSERISKLEEIIQKLTGEKKTLLDELSQSLSENEILTGKLNQSLSENEILTGKLNQSLSENETLSGKLNLSLSENDQLKTEKKELEEKHAEMIKKIKNLSDTIETLQNEVQTLRGGQKE